MNHQLQTVEVYNQHVDQYVRKFMDFDLYNDTFDYFLNLLPQKAKVLELGCGPGNVVKYFLQQRQDLKITGLDLAPEMIKKAKELNPGAAFEVMDIRKAGTLTETFDAVTCPFCLPYLSFSDLPAFFTDIKKISSSNGLLYLSCMEGKPEQSGFEKTSFTGDSEMYIYYHQRENLEKHLAQNGFIILKFYTKDYPETDGSVTTDLIYIAQKQMTGQV